MTAIKWQEISNNLHIDSAWHLFWKGQCGVRAAEWGKVEYNCCWRRLPVTSIVNRVNCGLPLVSLSELKIYLVMGKIHLSLLRGTSEAEHEIMSSRQEKKNSINDVTLAYAWFSTYLNKWIWHAFTKALYTRTNIIPSLSSHKQIFLTLICICVFLKNIYIYKKNMYLSLVVYLLFSPFFTVPHTAGQKPMAHMPER